MSKMFCFDILRKLLICNKMLLLYRYKIGLFVEIWGVDGLLGVIGVLFLCLEDEINVC